MSVESEAPSLTTVVEGTARLVGSACGSCSTQTFPSQATCPRCGSNMAAAALPTEGAVWSWTVQRIAVKAHYAGPQPFEPFTVGYVDLGGVKVESPLFGHPVDGWRIGEPVQLVAGGVAGSEHPHLPFWFEAKEPSL